MVTGLIPRMTLLVLAWLMAVFVWSVPAGAQPQPTASQIALRDAIVDRFEVVPLTDGLVFAPKDASAYIRFVQLEDGAIAIDGALVSGQELSDRLGDDADLIIRASYLDPELRVSLLGGNIPVAAPPAEVTSAPPPPPPLPPPPPPLERRTTSSGIVRFGGSVQVDADERVRGDVLALGGPVAIDGEVTGDIVVIGGSAWFGPEAEINGEVTVIGGPIDRARTASIRRGINEIGFNAIDFGDFEMGEWFRIGGGPMMWRGWSRGGWDLAGTVLRLIFLALIACVVVFVAQGSVERVAARSAAEPLKAGLIGFLTQVLLVPILVLGILILVVSIIGIPLLVLLPFAILGLFVAMVVGFAGSAHALGRWLGHRMGRASQPIYLSVWVGIALMLLPTMAGEAFELAGGPFRAFAVLLVLTGALVEYAVWTSGLGAIVLNRFGSPPPAAAGPAVPLASGPAVDAPPDPS